MPRIIISEEGQKSQPYKIKLTNKIVKIGRDPSCQIVLQDVNASSHHCNIKRVSGGLVAIDQNSTNGLIYEEQRYKYIDLLQDTEFFLGDVKVNIVFSDDEYDILSEEEFESVQISLADYQNKNGEFEEVVEIEEEEIEQEEEEEEVVVVKKKRPASPAQNTAPKIVIAAAGAAPAVRATTIPYVQKKSDTPLFLLLSLIAIIGGFCLKHYQETDGEFLLSNLFGDKIETNSQTNVNETPSVKE